MVGVSRCKARAWNCACWSSCASRIPTTSARLQRRVGPDGRARQVLRHGRQRRRSAAYPRFGETIISVPVSISVFRIARQAIGVMSNEFRGKLAYEMTGRLAGPAFQQRDFKTKGGIHLARGNAPMRHVERHRTQRIGWLRAAVLGANDGIVSTASLSSASLQQDRTPRASWSRACRPRRWRHVDAAGEYVSVSSQAIRARGPGTGDQGAGRGSGARARGIDRIYVTRGWMRPSPPASPPN